MSARKEWFMFDVGLTDKEMRRICHATGITIAEIEIDHRGCWSRLARYFRECALDRADEIKFVNRRSQIK